MIQTVDPKGKITTKYRQGPPIPILLLFPHSTQSDSNSTDLEYSNLHIRDAKIYFCLLNDYHFIKDANGPLVFMFYTDFIYFYFWVLPRGRWYSQFCWNAYFEDTGLCQCDLILKGTTWVWCEFCACCACMCLLNILYEHRRLPWAEPSSVGTQKTTHIYRLPHFGTRYISHSPTSGVTTPVWVQKTLPYHSTTTLNKL